MERRTFLKSAVVGSGLLAALPLSRGFAEPTDDGFPLMDLHVHLTPTFTIDQVMEIAKKTGVQFGIMVNSGGAVSDDADLRRFIDSLKPYRFTTAAADESGLVQELFARSNQAGGLRLDGAANHSQRERV